MCKDVYNAVEQRDKQAHGILCLEVYFEVGFAKQIPAIEDRSIHQGLPAFDVAVDAGLSDSHFQGYVREAHVCKAFLFPEGKEGVDQVFTGCHESIKN